KINPTGGKFSSDLPPVSVKGQYSFYGNSVAANVATSLEYRYRLSRSQGTWIVTLPIELKLPGVVYGVDKNGKQVPVLSNRLDIAQPLAVELGLMSHDGKGSLECDQGREKWKTTLPGVTPSRVIDTGFIGPNPDTYDGAACRLPLDRTLAAGKPLLSKYYDFWTHVIQTAWSRSGFYVKVWIIGHIDIDATVMKTLERDDQIWHIHMSLDPNQRPRYRSGFLSEPHFYTGAYPDTIAHEAGHELGLDDEYRENDKGGKNAWRDCAGDSGTLPGATYIMCDASAVSIRDVPGQPRWWEKPYTVANAAWWTAPFTITSPEAAKGIYPWIITRRYVVGLADQCFDDADCKQGQQYCDKGGVAGIGRNQCVAKKKENESCGADAQCLTPAVCKGKPLGRCASENTVEFGGACTRDIQCMTGSCSADGHCQCVNDTDCKDGQYCDNGSVAGIGRNQCMKRKVENEACGADSQCVSPAICKGKPLGRCATESSVGLGGNCSRDTQCKTGSCDNNGSCQCTMDSDCGSSGNWQCDKGSLGLGRNICVDTSATRGLDAACVRDSECSSDSCSSKGHCQCKDDKDCKKNQQC
ncbi:MAG: Dickkopf N-terminal cysteine-rich domain-containing protein, partial [Betaproteobacteria bacterium]